MAESSSSFASIRKWIVEHKLRTVGCLWLSGIGSSIAYNWSRPNMKTSVKVIHARVVLSNLFSPQQEFLRFVPSYKLHAQALTLAALAGAAVVEYYDHQPESESNMDKYRNQFLANSQKD